MFDSIIRQATQISYPCVGHEPQPYLARTPLYKVIKKYAHKNLRLRLGGQLGLLTPVIPRGARVLLLYTGKTSIGDVNLELSGRRLLKGKGVQIDILVQPSVEPLLKEDDVFGRIYTDPQQINPADYDHVLLVEFNHRSIALKIQYFKYLPLSCMFGYFDGPDRNQCLFSHCAINDIFSLGLSESEILAVARPYLASQSPLMHVLPADHFVVIGLGGVDPGRTWAHWHQFLEMWDARLQKLSTRVSIVLLGSPNGLSQAQVLSSLSLNAIDLTDWVAQTSMIEAFNVLQKARLYIGCDGGLMHIAHAAGVPSVSIFRRQEPYVLRLTPACRSTTLVAAGDVSDVEPMALLEVVERRWAIPPQ